MLVYVFLGLLLITLSFGLKLHWITTLILGGFLFGMSFLHRKRYQEKKRQINRFYEACTYMDNVLYAFLKEGKILRSFEDVEASLAEGDMKSVVGDALDYMRMTFDETEVIEDAMKCVERAYSCERIKAIHEFMLHVEYYGGNIEKPVSLLLEDKKNWQNRIQLAIKEREKMFVDVILSVFASLIICAVILYLPVLQIDISKNWFVQGIAVVVVILDDLIILKGQKYLSVDWLRLDVQAEDEYYEKKMKEFLAYDKRKEIIPSFICAILLIVPTIYFLYKGKKWLFLIGCFISLFAMNQHKVGHRLAKKRLVANIKSTFPKWLLDLILLLQSENVQVAILKTKDHVPGVLKEDINLLVSKLEMSPESSEPYHSFLEQFHLPEIHSAMSMLYSLSMGNSANADRQVSELVQRNMEMLNEAEKERLHNQTSGLYLLFLAPILTASIKLIVDMAVFMLAFLGATLVQ